MLDDGERSILLNETCDQTSHNQNLDCLIVCVARLAVDLNLASCMRQAANFQLLFKISIYFYCMST